MAEGLKNENKHKIVQTLLLFAVIALFGLIYFGVFGSGLFLDIALGFTSMFLATLLSSIFVERKGWYPLFHKGEYGVVYLLLAGLGGVAIIVMAALGYITSGVVLSFGIQLFLIGMFNLLRFLNENLSKSVETENNFLKLFYKTENTTLATSILTCLSLSVMVLCGYCDLVFAISFGTPLLGVSLILKLGMFLYDRYRNGKQQTKIVLTDNSNENKNIDLNLDLNNNKDDLGNNQFSPQGNDNEKNKKTNLDNPQ